MFERHLQPAVDRAMSDSPVVFLQGPRQAGKSTLAGIVAAARPGMARVNFDDVPALVAARRDPVSFVARFPNGVFIDEVQRALEVVLPIKHHVDRERRPGGFLLTGSAQVLTLPRLADSLAGRMETLTLWPLSQGEIDGVVEGFVDVLFGPGALPEATGVESIAAIEARLLRGGYPEAVQRTDTDRRAVWFASYASALVQRDIRELANIDALGDLDRLLRLVASRTSQLTNVAEFSRVLGLPQTTLKRYLQLLEAVHLVRRLEPWSANTRARLVRTPKLLFCDSGLAAHLVDADSGRLERDPILRGHLLESFVAAEVQKQLGWSRARARLFHFRTARGEEVDLVLEGPGGAVVGIEVKSTATPDPRDARGLEALREIAGKRFHRGVLLHPGREVLPFGAQIWAVPIEMLWSWRAPKAV